MPDNLKNALPAQPALTRIQTLKLDMLIVDLPLIPINLKLKNAQTKEQLLNMASHHLYGSTAPARLSAAGAARIPISKRPGRL